MTYTQFLAEAFDIIWGGKDLNVTRTKLKQLIELSEKQDADKS